MNSQLPPTTENKSFNSRSQARFRFRLKADAHVEGLGLFQGYVKDISLQGVTIYIDRNLPKDTTIQIRIHVPPEVSSDVPHLVVASGKVLHSIYDSGELNFRIGVKLMYFASDTDETYLKKYLKIR